MSSKYGSGKECCNTTAKELSIMLEGTSLGECSSWEAHVRILMH